MSASKNDNSIRPWFSHCLPLHHRSAMTAEIVWQRNQTILMLFVYLISCCVLEALPLYFVRKTPTIIIINVIFGIETSIGICGFLFSNIYLILGFLSSFSASIFVFLLYFIFACVVKGDWILLMVHGIPMVFDILTLGSTAWITLGYWKWRQALAAKVTGNESHSASSFDPEAVIVETKVFSLTTAENSELEAQLKANESHSTSSSGSEAAFAETKVSSETNVSFETGVIVESNVCQLYGCKVSHDNCSLTTAENSEQSDLELGASASDGSEYFYAAVA
jgi:hypothetical protein